jgi:hypothetical protein
MPGFTNTVTALNLLQAKIQALQWNNAPAFGQVSIFDATDFLVALRELMAFADRICIIIHDRERYISTRKGTVLDIRQHRDVTLVMADRHLLRTKALMGDPAPPAPGIPTPGAFNLKDLVIQPAPAGIIGLLQPGMYIEPLEGEQMILTQKVREELQGRVAFTMSIRLWGGNVLVPIGIQPIP